MEGFEMMFDGEADESPDWDVAGDVHVQVHSKRDDEWRRKDAGLYRREIIGVDEALLGFDRNLTHMDGKTVRVVRSGTTQPGHIDVFKGEGVGFCFAALLPETSCIMG
jgi:DnaJ-related protein SCJ1